MWFIFCAAFELFSSFFVLCNFIRVVVERAADLTNLHIKQNPRLLSGRTLIDLLVSYNVQTAVIERGVRVTAWYSVFHI